MNLSHNARVVLINTGKILPFALCFVVFVSYIENILAILIGSMVLYGDNYILYKPVSHFIGQYFEYDLLSVFITLIISVAIETCKWNKLAILYLALHLAFKWSISDIEFSLTAVFLFSVVNAVISSFLVYKGVRMLIFC